MKTKLDTKLEESRMRTQKTLNAAKEKRENTLRIQQEKLENTNRHVQQTLDAVGKKLEVALQKIQGEKLPENKGNQTDVIGANQSILKETGKTYPQISDTRSNFWEESKRKHQQSLDKFNAEQHRADTLLERLHNAHFLALLRIPNFPNGSNYGRDREKLDMLMKESIQAQEGLSSLTEFNKNIEEYLVKIEAFQPSAAEETQSTQPSPSLF